MNQRAAKPTTAPQPIRDGALKRELYMSAIHFERPGSIILDPSPCCPMVHCLDAPFERHGVPAHQSSSPRRPRDTALSVIIQMFASGLLGPSGSVLRDVRMTRIGLSFPQGVIANPSSTIAFPPASPIPNFQRVDKRPMCAIRRVLVVGQYDAVHQARSKSTAQVE